MPIPLISVVMPVYNAAPFVEEATRSILEQTLGDFEFIIINDGSTDGSKVILDRLAADDNRIQLIHQSNRGVTPSLNRGLEIARGRYIARMDADDISHPERFERQVAFLDKHLEAGVLGTQVQYIDREGISRDASWFLPTSPGLTAWRTLFRCAIAHPTVMMRSNLFPNEEAYNEEAVVAEDYELWTRLTRKTQISNLPDTLLQLRRWGKNITSTQADRQESQGITSAFRLHEKHIGSQSDKNIVRFLRHQQHAYAGWAIERGSYSAADLSQIATYLVTLLHAFLDYHDWSDDEVRRIKEDAFGKLCDIARVVGQHHSKLTEWRIKARAHALQPRQIPHWLSSSLRRQFSS